MIVYSDEIYVVDSVTAAQLPVDFDEGDVVNVEGCEELQVVVITNGVYLFEEYTGFVKYRAPLNDFGYCECGNVLNRGTYCSECLAGE